MSRGLEKRRGDRACRSGNDLLQFRTPGFVGIQRYFPRSTAERATDVIRIAVIGGDGTGPEVVAEGLKVLHAAGPKVGFEYETASSWTSTLTFGL